MNNNETIAEGKWLKLEKKGTWEFASRINCTGCVFVPSVNNDGDYIFVEQFRPAVGADVIEFPAGLVGDEDSDETFITAAIRELEEETGYRPSKTMVVPYKIFSSPGMVSEGANWVICAGCEQISDGGGVAGENIKVHIVDKDGVLNWIQKQSEIGKVIGTSVFTGIYLLGNYESFEQKLS